MHCQKVLSLLSCSRCSFKHKHKQNKKCPCHISWAQTEEKPELRTQMQDTQAEQLQYSMFINKKGEHLHQRWGRQSIKQTKSKNRYRLWSKKFKKLPLNKIRVWPTNDYTDSNIKNRGEDNPMAHNDRKQSHTIHTRKDIFKIKQEISVCLLCWREELVLSGRG